MADADATTPFDRAMAVIDGLVGGLSKADDTAGALRAAVEAAREGVGADLAFWYAKPGGPTYAAGSVVIADDRCRQFARRLLAAVPAEPAEFRWADPDSRAEGQPTAAVVSRGPAGALVALGFGAGRRFTSADEALLRVAVRLYTGMRARAQAATRAVLHGLMQSLTAILDAKDPYTAGHSERVARIAVLIGGQLGLSSPVVGDLFLAGLLHDIGKIGTRDDVLLKSGSLTAAEFEQIQAHPVTGDQIVASIEPFRRLRPGVRHHHERWDGTGYPDRLAGEAIPLLGRVLGVADAVDAMMSPRRYRPAKSPVLIDAVLRQESGRQFDPAVVAAFDAIRTKVYPPIYQKGVGESAYHAIGDVLGDRTDATFALAADSVG